MRDALSLMDQVLSFAEGRVTGEDVRRVLGLVSEELYLELFAIVAEKRYADVFHFVQRTIDDGYDLAEFYKGLADALRALMVAKLEGADAADVREDLRGRYADTAEQFGRGDLLRMLSMVAELDTEGKFRKSANPRTMLEALLLRWAFLESTVDVEMLLRAAGGDAPVPLVERAADPPRRPASDPTRDSRRGTTTADPATARSILADIADNTSASTAPLRAATAAPAAVPASRPAAYDAPSAPLSTREAEHALRTMLEQRRAPHGIGIFLKAATIGDVTGTEVVLEVPAGPGFERLSGESATRVAVRDIIAEILGRSIELSIRAAGHSDPDAGDASSEQPRRITPAAVRAERLATISRDDPAVRAAVRSWDLELID
jgi:DNA polymerase III gamma/tau subunit